MMQGLAGWMALTGEPDGPPTKSGLSLVDLSGGYVAALAMLAGLWRARRDGTGCDCDVALLDVALHELMYVGTWAASRGYVPPRRSNSAHPSLVPFQNFETADGWIVVAAPKEKFWVRVCEAIGQPELATRSALRGLRRARPQPRRAGADPRARRSASGRRRSGWRRSARRACRRRRSTTCWRRSTRRGSWSTSTRPSARCARSRRPSPLGRRAAGRPRAVPRRARRGGRRISSARDLVGYGAEPPDPRWPGGARLALSFVLNYEEGGENTPLEGDEASEAFLHEVVGAPATVGRRNLNAESMFEFGSRAGFWRVLAHLHAARAAADRLRGRAGARAEPGGRDGRWSRRAGRSRATAGAGSTTPRCRRRRSASTCGSRSTRSSACAGRGRSAGTRAARRRTRAGSSSRRAASSTTPTPTRTSSRTGSRSPARRHLVIPYTLDANDFKFLIPNGFVTADDFTTYLVDTFDQLYEEGGRMMNVGLHCRIVGRPGRAPGLDRFLEHVASRTVSGWRRARTSRATGTSTSVSELVPAAADAVPGDVAGEPLGVDLREQPRHFGVPALRARRRRLSVVERNSSKRSWHPSQRYS